MRKDWKYIVYVGAAVLIYVLVKAAGPRQFDWTVTLAHDDKDPYGTFVLDQVAQEMFGGHPVTHSYKTLYELKDTVKTNDNILILASNFSCGKEDTDVLLDHVRKGGNALISAQYFWGHFSDTLNVATYDYLFTEGNVVDINDSTSLSFSNPNLDTAARYWFRRENIHNYFESFDTTRTTVIARNDRGQPVTIRVSFGKGNFILNSTPLAFTNIYMLAGRNREFVTQTLSYLPAQPSHRTEFYHVGRMESGSPLRFVLTNESLAWGYYLTIGLVFIFMIFEAKRKQRIIPIVKPPANTSLEFVATIGNLYYQNGDHKNIADKKIAFLLEQIRSKYLLRTSDWNEEFFVTLASKSANSTNDVKALFRTISYISSSTLISAEQLADLNHKIEKFNHESE